MRGGRRKAKKSRKNTPRAALKVYQRRKRALRGETPATFSDKVYAEGASQRIWLEARRVSEIEASGRKIWAWTVTGAVLLFFTLLVIDAGGWLGWWSEPSMRQKEIMEQADLMAIMIFAIDIYGRYRVATDKMLFLRQSAFEIIAILPMGLLFRMGQAFEAAGLLRNLQVAARVEEMAVFAPALGALKGAHLAPQIERAGKLMPEIGAAVGEIVIEAQKIVANYAVVTDFVATVGSWAARILKR